MQCEGCLNGLPLEYCFFSTFVAIIGSEKLMALIVQTENSKTMVFFFGSTLVAK
jgi:hypothetical protein